jgi:triacylglycerol lipase
MSTIILAHGLFGFGDLLPGVLSFLPSLHYFNGVADHLRENGHTVLEPQVNPIGSIQSRGDQLAMKILKQTSPNDRVHILAHSMGGLDARHAITNRNDLVPRIATLVTIGTPHRGSPVADAIVSGSGPLFQAIPNSFKHKLQQNAGALHDLTSGACIPFNQGTADAANVRYINVAGDASLGGDELLLFQLAAAIGNITGEINDGVVTKSSALRAGNQHLADWPVDHAGEIGWSLSMLPTAAHLARYDDIVKAL